MRTTAFVLLAALTAFAAGGCNKKPGATGGGPAGIEGKYIVTDFEMGGEKSKAEELSFLFGKDEAERTIIIANDTITFNRRKGGEDNVKKYKLDPSKTPAEIDFTYTESGGKPETAYGIYKIEGDTLTIALAGPNKDGKSDPKDRPKEFKTKKEGEDLMFTFKKK